MYSMGASSRSPSPMTTVPQMVRLSKAWRMASTAASSAPGASPRPMNRAEASAAASVTRTASRARFRSMRAILTERRGFEHLDHRFGPAHRFAPRIDAGVQGEAVGAQLFAQADLVLETHAGRTALGHHGVDAE